MFKASPLTEIVLAIVDGSLLPGDAVREIEERISASVAEEREACAQLAEGWPYPSPSELAARHRHIAYSIRARTSHARDIRRVI